MKRPPHPFTYGVSDADVNDVSPRQWRSLDEHADSKAFKEAYAREFPDGAAELGELDQPGSGVSRRGFIGLLGASFGLAGLAACRRPEEKVLPYNKRGDVTEGRSSWYATAMPFYGSAVGLLVESHEGRPTKIEGNPRHPETGSSGPDDIGGSSAYVQAAILELYDPDRSQKPVEKTREATWDEASLALAKLGAAAKAKNGRGLAILTEPTRSPTVLAQLDALKKAMPDARVVRYEPFGRWNVREGARLAFGKALETSHKTGAAQVILSLGSDFLQTESSAIKNARGFANGRRVAKPTDGMNRLYVAESQFSVSGAAADHRLRLPTSELHNLALALAAELAAAGAPLGVNLPSGQVDPARRRFVTAAARDLVKHKGAGLVVAGEQLPPAVHAIVALANLALGNVGRTVDHFATVASDPEGPTALVQLAEAMKKGEVDTLVILGGNPAYNAPVDADFGAALAKVANSVHLSTHVDETSALCGWHLNRAHFLEAWGDVRSDDGTASVVQPLIAPLFGGKSDAEVLDKLLGGTHNAYQLTQATWATTLGGGGIAFARSWRQALHDGVLAGTTFAAEKVAQAADGAAIGVPAKSVTGVEVTFHLDAHAWDGRFANNSWLQEMPDPMTKLTWDNAAAISVASAKKLGLESGDFVEISVAGGKPTKVPVIVAPGQADDSLALTIGQGRTHAGSVGSKVGFDLTALRSSAAFGVAAATLKKAGGERYKLATTQEHAVMEGRPLVREASLLRFRSDPKFVQKAETLKGPPFSLFDDVKYDAHKWGMVIDLNACIGCNACMVACQAENNIPVVGKAGVARSRSMHWMRIDRYFTGDNENDPQAVMQPIGCQHCENAPCEQVCPVGATTHSPEGLNDIAYNRCIGTRYCANNCPFKVRRFNFFNYTKDTPELKRMQYNPEVTVRFRGVIEKCSYCVQRINKAKIAAHKDKRDRVRDGEVKSACMQGCPTQAIVFGDLNDPTSAVAKAAANPRDYKLLEELNVRARTSFLGRVRNPNPELA